jgi:hypothetical protein
LVLEELEVPEAVGQTALTATILFLIALLP